MIGRLHVVTSAAGGAAALAAVRAALAGGAPVVQVRTKTSDDRSRYAFAREVVLLCRAAGALCIVNDRVDLALAARADGTHVGADDLPVEVVRRIAGPAHLIGGTARDPARAAELVAAGADYLGVGPAFATVTKDGLPDPIGPAGVGAVAAAVKVPVIAIGGVTAARVPSLRAAGAHGVAVVSAVSDAPDPAAAAASLLSALDGAR
ncbi:thiamine phosphate synthase [Asanoa sp. WMMD1127]|uniref:thiamine phosphate synthase n=1 Tax=Asanoa sp. WMMD1127 TaxID=3016107 RepID=UPI0024167E76|nr:thiamine phosphate synthase [Asanoa sp. WMMD1127]MDG4825590.1 thiamine phosphate synthase [Asanoa sp. WMMD1127]